MTDYLNPHRISANYPVVNRAGEIQTGRIDIAPGFDSVRPTVKESLLVAKRCVACGAEMAAENPSQTCWVCEDIRKPIPCAWCNPEHHLLRFNVSWWVRASTGKRKWMSVTQQYKKQVNFCPMCGRKLEESK